MRRYLFDLLEIDNPDHMIDNWLEWILFGLISLNIVALVVETVDSIGVPYANFFHWFDITSLVIFALEYFCRIWSCTLDSRYSKPILGRFKYATTGYMVLDLIIILPLFVHIIGIDTRLFLILRILRLLRVLKLTRYSKNFARLVRVVKKKKGDLIAAVGLVLALVLMVSSVMYFAEHDAQPDKFPSIPAAMWWGIVTLTTVGYGDVFPTTTLGKLVCGFTTILSIGMVALPAGILSSGFQEEVQTKTEVDITVICPHCGGSHNFKKEVT